MQMGEKKKHKIEGSELIFNQHKPKQKQFGNPHWPS